MTIKTNNPIEDLTIETEPDFRFRSENDIAYTGEFFDIHARVKIHVSEGSPENYIIIAHPEVLDDSAVSLNIIPQSQYQLNGDKKNYLA